MSLFYRFLISTRDKDVPMKEEHYQGKLERVTNQDHELLFGEKILGKQKLDWEVGELFDYGKVRDVEVYCEFIDFLARKLNTNLKEVPLLLTSQNNYQVEDLKNITKMVFESKESPALFFVRKGVCVLFANGKTNGINLESGHRQTHIVPVHDGYSLQKHCKTIRIGGKIVDDFIRSLIKKQTNKDHVTAPFELFPNENFTGENSRKLKFKQVYATPSYREYSQNKVITDCKPILNKLRQIKQGE
jgi:actin-like protein 6A